jgi:hypothetical protein
MAEHNLFLGGDRTKSCGFYEALPSQEMPPNGAMTGTTHKHNPTYSLTRHLAWKCPPCPKTGQAEGSAFLANYLERETIVAGDILNLAIMPRMASLLKVWWQIKEPLDGFAFTLQVRGNAHSISGDPTGDVASAAPIVLASAIDGAQGALDEEGCLLASGLIGIDPEAQGDPLCSGIYFDQNDMLQLVIESLPEDGIACSELCISPVIMDYCEGSY